MGRRQDSRSRERQAYIETRIRLNVYGRKGSKIISIRRQVGVTVLFRRSRANRERKTYKRKEWERKVPSTVK